MVPCPKMRSQINDRLPLLPISGDGTGESFIVSSTLAGNLTLVGSVANLIVVQVARARGVTIGFWEYAKVGAPLTVLTLLIGVLWLQATG